ncbi:hypothetical protein J7L67_10385 [bacterium]|nr:hypothetical protein [bacterium]
MKKFITLLQWKRDDNLVPVHYKVSILNKIIMFSICLVTVYCNLSYAGTQAFFRVSAVLPSANALAQIFNIAVTGSSATINIQYDLTDNDGNICSVELQYKKVGASIWSDATVSGMTALILPSTDLSLGWNSMKDVPTEQGSLYQIRMRAYDSTDWGQWQESEQFYLINTYIVTRIDFNLYPVCAPQINNNEVAVWDGDFVENTITKASDIYLYETENISMLTNSQYYAYTPKLNDNGNVVWFASDGYDGLPGTGTDYEIYFYDGSSTIQLTDNNLNDTDPQLNDNDNIVWSASDGFNFEIFLYDDSTTKQLNSPAADNIEPKINNANHIVWCGWDGNDWEIFLYDGSTVTQLTNNSYNDNDAQINNYNEITWCGWDGNDWEIFLYDGSTVTQLTNNSYDDIIPQINDLGQIVWSGYDGNDYEIFLYDATIRQITDNDNDDLSPQLNNIGSIVWSSGNMDKSDIYVYNNATITRVTQNSYRDIDPQINDNRYIIWRRWDGIYWNIIIAGPPEIFIVSIENQPITNLINLIWYVKPQETGVKILWTNEISGSTVWDEVSGPALDDILDLSDGLKSWIDHGTDPEMNGEASSDVLKRFYKIELDND